MTITSLTLTNPGAETGDTSGWTIRSGSASFASVAGGHSGSKQFQCGVSSIFHNTLVYDQEVDLTAYATEIDADTAAIDAYVWIATDGFGISNLYVQFLDTTHTSISTTNADSIQSGTYVQSNLRLAIPVNTRYVRIGTSNAKTKNANSNTFQDDYSISIGTNREADYPGTFAVHTYQAVSYALVSEPAAQLRTLQAPVLVVSSAETSNANYLMKTHQVVAYALVRGIVDRRDLRCWRFPQDDHEFYVLQLGADGTLIYDMLTQQWAEWKSPTKNFWRGNDGCDWVAAGINVCCDTESGIIWQIDPSGRLDAGTTPITSQITGGLTKRFRTNTPCYMAELAVSEGKPPNGIDASTVGINLRTYDTLTTTDYGTVTGEAIGNRITVRWYGLGLMSSPGVVFQITDTGYARRIDGLNIEVGNSGN